METDYDIDMPNVLKPLLVPVELKQVLLQYPRWHVVVHQHHGCPFL